ncbi:hypothetical protein EDM56_29835 [Brevibacillus fluminis]|uniref:Uncharacterized protein n=1 Tax=Brevibacillus fluminis TaxID=511487 RepID=A0A3M8CTI3_9BACL|nr:hypothetical protein EDM56_29835 [Brevibacillus fluminis]
MAIDEGAQHVRHSYPYSTKKPPFPREVGFFVQQMVGFNADNLDKNKQERVTHKLALRYRKDYNQSQR